VEYFINTTQGMAPTIIAVRVGLGYSVESVDSFIVSRPLTRRLPQFNAASDSEATLGEGVLYLGPESTKQEVV
jgi:hypothetical protein